MRRFEFWAILNPESESLLMLSFKNYQNSL